MKAKLGKVLRSEFHKRMSACLPEFEKAEDFNGRRVYRRRDLATGYYIFVVVWPHTKIDSFTFELAANLEARYPHQLLPQSPEEVSPDGAVRMRIQRFLEPTTKADHGWWRVNLTHTTDLAAFMNSYKTVDEDAAKLPAIVEDAFGDLQKALPKFMDLVRSRLTP